MVVGIGDEGVGVGAAAGLDGGDLFGVLEVGDVEDADAAEAVVLGGRGVGLVGVGVGFAFAFGTFTASARALLSPGASGAGALAVARSGAVASGFSGFSVLAASARSAAVGTREVKLWVPQSRRPLGISTDIKRRWP